MGQALKEGHCPTFTWRKVALFFLLLNLLLIIGLVCSHYFQGAEASPRPELRVMLLGKNGAAKRILGNAILGRKAFPPRPEIAIVHQCRAKNGLALGDRNVTVLDTLEILNTLDMAQRLNACVHWVAPGPHLFLYAAEPGEWACEGVRFIRRSLGRAAARFTVVVFGGVHRREERRTEEDVRKELTKCFVGGYHIFSGDLDGDPNQIRALMEKMDTFMSDHMGYKAKNNKT